MGFWKRLFRSHAELVSEELQLSAKNKGAKPIRGCAEREVVELCGTVSLLRVNPRSGTPWLEAVLDDGSGSVTLVWMGRRAIAGISPGRALKVWGRIVEANDRLCIFNPTYELLPS